MLDPFCCRAACGWLSAQGPVFRRPVTSPSVISVGKNDVQHLVRPDITKMFWHLADENYCEPAWQDIARSCGQYNKVTKILS